MKITLVTILSALAALSVAEAVPAYRRHDNKPKYYFPRVVKRQVDSPFGNSTTTDTSTDTASGVDGVLSDANNALSSVAGVLADTTTTTGADTTPADTASAPADTPTVSTPDPADSAATTTDGGLLATVSSLVGSVVSNVASAGSDLLNTESTPTTTTAFIVGVDTVISGSQADTGAPTTTTDGGLLDTVTNVANSVLASASTAASSVLSVASSLQDAVSTAASSDLAAITSALSSAQSVASSIAADVSSANSVITSQVDSQVSQINSGISQITSDINTISVDPGTGITGSVTVPPPIDTGSVTVPPPIDTGSVTVSPPIDTGTPPTVSETPPPQVSPTDTPTFPATPSLAPPPVLNQTSAEATPSLPPSSRPETIKPTGTDTNTALTPESSILSASPTKSGGSQVPSSSSSAIPTTLPSVITPDGGVPKAPDNATLIQIGFLYGLNYEFVVKSSTAQAQIFTYLPMGVTGGLDISKKQMVMQYLQPYNTLPTAGYITTLAMAYIPSEQLDQLSVDLLNPKSDLYTQGDDSVKTLMSMIDPTVPLLAGSGLTQGGTPINSANGAATTTDGNGEDGAPGSGDTGSTSPVRPSSVGIAVGAVGGAIVYGAAMFLVARRYKKRKAAHQRSSSVMSGRVRRPAETSNLMTGARNSYGSRFLNGRGSPNSDRSDESGSGRSGRTYISPPVMAENSLGWN